MMPFVVRVKLLSVTDFGGSNRNVPADLWFPSWSLGTRVWAGPFASSVGSLAWFDYRPEKLLEPISRSVQHHAHLVDTNVQLSGDFPIREILKVF